LGKSLKEIIGKGRVRWLNENGKQALYLDNDKGVGQPIQGTLEIAGVAFHEEDFKPYLMKIISIIIEKEKGKIPNMIIKEEN
jgi:hypothetical protein